MYGDPVTTSMHSRYMIFKRKLPFLRQVSKAKHNKNPEEIVEMALNFSIVLVTPFGMKLRKHVNVYKGIKQIKGA